MLTLDKNIIRNKTIYDIVNIALNVSLGMTLTDKSWAKIW